MSIKKVLRAKGSSCKCHQSTIQLFILISLFLHIPLVVAVDKSANAQVYKAELKGSEEVPPVKTAAKGEATFRVFKGKMRMTYLLTVSDIENVTAAHIHRGKKGKSGPPVVVFFNGHWKAGKFSSTLSEGIITGDDLRGSLSGKPLRALIQMIYAGEAYVNVHTEKYPEGEIRGQIGR